MRFAFTLKEAGKSLPNYHRPFLNSNLKESNVYTFEKREWCFKQVKEVCSDNISKFKVPVILDTPTSVFLWVPKKFWDEEGKRKETAFDISEVNIISCVLVRIQVHIGYNFHSHFQLFIVQKHYPKWTPVTVVTDQFETEEFTAHFPSWPWVDLQLAQRSDKLRLPFIKAPNLSYPATGQTKVATYN